MLLKPLFYRYWVFLFVSLVTQACIPAYLGFYWSSMTLRTLFSLIFDWCTQRQRLLKWPTIKSDQSFLAHAPSTSALWCPTVCSSVIHCCRNFFCSSHCAVVWLADPDKRPSFEQVLIVRHHFSRFDWSIEDSVTMCLYVCVHVCHRHCVRSCLSSSTPNLLPVSHNPSHHQHKRTLHMLLQHFVHSFFSSSGRHRRSLWLMRAGTCRILWWSIGDKPPPHQHCSHFLCKLATLHLLHHLSQ